MKTKRVNKNIEFLRTSEKSDNKSDVIRYASELMDKKLAYAYKAFGVTVRIRNEN